MAAPMVAVLLYWGRAQKTGPDSPVDKRPDIHVTGALPASMTSFIGRSRVPAPCTAGQIALRQESAGPVRPKERQERGGGSRLSDAEQSARVLVEDGRGGAWGDLEV